MSESESSPVVAKEDSRTHILHSAAAVFAEHGFAGARIDAIAVAAGYNKSLIYQYFGDKVGLYLAVIRSLKGDLDEQTNQMTSLLGQEAQTALQPDQVRQVVTRGVRWIFDFYLEHPSLVRILAWEAAGGWQVYNQVWGTSGFLDWIHPVAEFIRQAQAQGIIYPDLDPYLIVVNMVDLIFQYNLSILRYQTGLPGIDLNSSEALGHARDHITALMVHGLLLPLGTD